MSMKKILVFDFDGVLFDTMALVNQATMELFPSLTEEMARELLVGNLHEGLEKIAHLRIQHTEEEKARWREEYSKKKAEAPMFVGAKAMLEELHAAGYILVLNTTAANQNCLPLLEKAEITGLFDFLATKEMSKSKVEKFTLIEEKYGISPNEMLFVTDSLGDLRESDIAGVPTIAVLWGAHDRSFFEREEHKNLIGVVESFKELMGLIESQWLGVSGHRKI